MNTTTLQQLTADFVSDHDQTRFTSAQYLSCINRAQEQFALDSKALFADFGFTTAVGDSTVDLPGRFILEEDVTLNGLPLKPVSRHTLNVLYPGTDWSVLEGTPIYYMINPQEGSLTMRLIPIPQEVLSGSLRYYPLPTEVLSGTDTVLNAASLMTQFHMAVSAMSAWLLLTFETSTPEIADKRRELIKIYSDGVSKAVETFGNTKSESIRIRPIF